MKRPLALVALVVLAAGLLTTLRTASANTNLINNPDIEQLGADGAALGWNQDIWRDNQAEHKVVRRGKKGGHALYVRISSHRSGDAKWYFDHVDVEPSTTYEFTNDYRSNVTTYVTLDVVLADGSHEYIGLGEAPRSPKKYTKFAATFTTPEDATKVSVWQAVASRGWLYTDNYSLTEAGGDAVPTPTSPPTTDAPTTDAPVTEAPPSTDAPPSIESPAPTTTAAPEPVPQPGPNGYPRQLEPGVYLSTLGVPEHLLAYKKSTTIQWNRPLPDDTPLDPNSASQAAVFAKYARSGGGMPNNYPGIFEDEGNAPQVFVVDSDQVEFVPVRFACPDGSKTWWNYNAAEFENYINNAYPGKYGVPIPKSIKLTKTNSNTDAGLAIYDYKHDVQFNFWVFNANGGTYTACWGGHIGGQHQGIKDPSKCTSATTPARYSEGDGTFCFPFGEDTAGFTDLGTNITLEEAQRGEINHAIAISIPHVREGGFSYPATRYNGWCTQMGIGAAIGGDQNCLYVGQRLRLPADFDTSTISHPFARMVAEAAKKYGFIVHDTAGCICIQSESSLTATSQGLPDPWPAIYGPGGNKAAYDAFPWEALQIVAKDYRW